MSGAAPTTPAFGRIPRRVGVRMWITNPRRNLEHPPSRPGSETSTDDWTFAVVNVRRVPPTLVWQVRSDRLQNEASNQNADPNAPSRSGHRKQRRVSNRIKLETLAGRLQRNV